MSDERHDRGKALLEQINSEGALRLEEDLREIAPDMADYVYAFAYGDIYSRPGLDLRMRELITVAALTALGNAPAQLASHVEGALNAGCSREEVREAIIQIAVYAGFPAALNGLYTARDVFRRLDQKSKL